MRILASYKTVFSKVRVILVLDILFNGLTGAFCGTIQQKGSARKPAVQQYAKAT